MQKKVKLLCKDWQIIEACFKMITTHFNNVKIQFAEYSNHFETFCIFVVKARQKIWENAKMPSFVSHIFCFEKCFKMDVIVSLQKRIICYPLWSIYWLANGQSALFRKWVFNYITSFWFLTLFLQFMKVHFILTLTHESPCIMYNVPIFKLYSEETILVKS